MTKEEKKQWQRQWYLKHRVLSGVKLKICVRCGKEYIPNSGPQKYCEKCQPIVKKERARQWYLENKEQAIERARQWDKNNPEKVREHTKRWRKNNPEKARTIARERARNRKSNCTSYLNKWFNGSESHHINKNCLVYIPKEIHQSIRHNIQTERGMFEINKLAFQYLINNIETII